MANRLIAQIKVKKLFGLYSYSLPEAGSFSNAAILYGDNGVGKSTILQLAFHLLSAAGDKGHRTSLYQAKFQSLEVTLSSGYVFEAFRKEGSKKNILSLTIRLGDKLLATWDYFPGHKGRVWDSDDDIFYISAEDGRVIKQKAQKKVSASDVPRGEHAYMEVLSKIVPTSYILNADRRLDSDAVSDPSDEMELRRMMHLEEARRIKDLVARSREIALSQALNAASRWIAKKAVQSANRGAENVHTVYGNVLKHLSNPSSNQINPESAVDFVALSKELNNIEIKTNSLAKYELTNALSNTEFKKALSARSKPKKLLIAGLLVPYLESLNSRLEAIEPIYKIIDKFVGTINDLLTDKSMVFTLSQGFKFRNRIGEPLDASCLSSGEQQLLLLFCYVLVARDNPSVFMIDEPEISLNIKWQRQLIQSLLDVTGESNIQFIFASHSMELLAQHRNRVVKLVDCS